MKMTSKPRLRTTLGIVTMVFGLFGCAGGGGGGGGGGGSSAGSSGTTIPTPPVSLPTVSVPVATADSFRTPEYLRMGVLDAVHAADAYALGYTGRGVTIGFVDFNFDFGSSEVRYDPASKGPDATSLALYQAQLNVTVDTSPHGNAVAATAGATKNDIQIHGIAFDANILAVDYFSDVNETQYRDHGTLVHVSDPWTYLTSHGARIVNTSYGFEGTDVVRNPPRVAEAYMLASSAQAVANGALLVASAGNAGGADPALSNMEIVDDLRSAGLLTSGAGAFIIAGSVDGTNTISSFSDRAGSLKDYYMVAPGENLILPWTAGRSFFLSGTSFSAPLISGAAAILFQKWPTLTARQVANILFQTATDLGDPGVDAIYGHGLLNVAAALQPVGVTTFAVADGGSPAAATTAMILGAAFGDAPAFKGALSHATMLDSFGRDFDADLSRSTSSLPALPDLFGTMQQKLGWHFAGFRLGSTSQFDFDLRGNPQDGVVGFGTAGGLDNSLALHQTVARFSGGVEGMTWTAGMGLSLRDALAPSDAGDPFTTLSLTSGFTSAVGGQPSAFAGLHLDLDSATTLSFGVSETQNQGISAFYIGSRYHNAGQTAALRLDQRIGKAHIGLELGSLVEEGGVLGSLAAGALKMADRSATSWASASYERALSAHWLLKGSLTVSATAASEPAASLITSIGPIYATSFALGLARNDVFGAGDAWTFAVDQPLRAERAPMSLTMGTGLDPATGCARMAETQTSLAPSGREIDFETGYRFPLGDWTGAMNAAYSRDAGHVRGENAVAGLFWLSRKF